MKKMFKKAVSLLLIMAMFLPMVSVSSIDAQAASYNRTAAVNYAKNHWNDGVGQCAQFVSACISAGGLPVSQNVCLNLWNTLKNYGTPYKLTSTSSGNGNIKLSSNTGKVEAGDPLFYVCETCGGTSSSKAFPHVVFCGGTDSSGYLTAYAHNAAWNNKKIWTQLNSSAHPDHKFSVYSIHIDVTPAKTYTITYDANGGYGAPSAQTYSSGSTVKISSVVPYRTGYSFSCWSQDRTASVVLGISPGTVQSFDGNITLYARWRHNGYTVKYNANGGSGSMSSTTHDYDISKNLAKNTFTRSGYTFLGWSTSSSATSASFSDGASVLNLTSSNGATVTLYAVWKKNTYTLTYNANGGSGAPSAQSGATSYKVSSTKPTRSGYTFLGWSTSSSAISASYVGGNTINISSNTTLYAVWEKKISYTLTYNANGGTGAPSAQSGAEGYMVSSTKPTRSGYTFLGWSTSRSATYASYSGGDLIELCENTTLYAVWKKNPVATPTVQIRNNPGTRTIKYGEILVLTADVSNIPEGARISWRASNDASGFEGYMDDKDANICYINGTGNGSGYVYLALVDADGNFIADENGEYIYDVQEIKVKAGFIQILINFFKTLFGLNRTVVQSTERIF